MTDATRALTIGAIALLAGGSARAEQSIQIDVPVQVKNIILPPGSSLAVDCYVTGTETTNMGFPKSVGSGQENVPLSDGSFNGTVSVQVAAQGYMGDAKTYVCKLAFLKPGGIPQFVPDSPGPDAPVSFKSPPRSPRTTVVSGPLTGRKTGGGRR